VITRSYSKGVTLPIGNKAAFPPAPCVSRYFWRDRERSLRLEVLLISPDGSANWPIIVEEPLLCPVLVEEVKCGGRELSTKGGFSDHFRHFVTNLTRDEAADRLNFPSVYHSDKLVVR